MKEFRHRIAEACESLGHGIVVFESCDCCSLFDVFCLIHDCFFGVAVVVFPRTDFLEPQIFVLMRVSPQSSGVLMRAPIAMVFAAHVWVLQI